MEITLPNGTTKEIKIGSRATMNMERIMGLIGPMAFSFLVRGYSGLVNDRAVVALYQAGLSEVEVEDVLNQGILTEAAEADIDGLTEEVLAAIERQANVPVSETLPLIKAVVESHVTGVSLAVLRRVGARVTVDLHLGAPR